jgi:hypothetical protein
MDQGIVFAAGQQQRSDPAARDIDFSPLTMKKLSLWNAFAFSQSPSPGAIASARRFAIMPSNSCSALASN